MYYVISDMTCAKHRGWNSRWHRKIAAVLNGVTYPQKHDIPISSQAISKGSSIFTWLMYAELSTNCNTNEARNSATIAYSESVIDGQTFSIDLEKSFTLSKNLSSSWIALINRLRPNSISKLQDDSM
ncbi:unnamed protein product, partial [Porites lobata]